MIRMLRAALCATLLGAALAAPASASQPATERVRIADIGVLDEELSGACGFDVLVDAIGHVTFRVFSDANGDPRGEVNNFAIRLRWYSEFGEATAVNVGPDRVTYLDDGSQILAITGNLASITAPGSGRVYSENGVITFLVTFDAEGNESFEFLSASGQHPSDSLESVLCELLAP